MTQPQILNKDDVRTAGGIVHSDGNVFFTNIEQLNAAVLAKLAGTEVPEQEIIRTDEVDRYGDALYVEGYTLGQLQQYGAACAAKILSKEPVGWVNSDDLKAMREHGFGAIVWSRQLGNDDQTALYTKEAA